MKAYYDVEIYILTDHQREWWISLAKDGSLERFYPSSSEMIPNKEFKTAEDAESYVKRHYAGRRYRVRFFEPPVSPARTWRQTNVESRSRGSSSTSLHGEQP